MDKTKNLKVSEAVHEELETRKLPNETFDDVLRRILGLHPTVQNLTMSLPEDLADVTNQIVEDYLDEARYEPVYEERENESNIQILKFVSEETGRRIVEIAVYPPGGKADRRNHRIDFRCRGVGGDMDRIARLRTRDGNQLRVRYTEYETHESEETDRNPGNIADLVGEHISKFAEQSYDRWG